LFKQNRFYSVKKRHGKTAILVKIERGRGKNEDDLEFMTFSSIIAHLYWKTKALRTGQLTKGKD
jgi:hypothetical protein